MHFERLLAHQLAQSQPGLVSFQQGRGQVTGQVRQRWRWLVIYGGGRVEGERRVWNYDISKGHRHSKCVYTQVSTHAKHLMI